MQALSSGRPLTHNDITLLNIGCYFIVTLPALNIGIIENGSFYLIYKYKHTTIVFLF